MHQALPGHRETRACGSPLECAGEPTPPSAGECLRVRPGGHRRRGAGAAGRECARSPSQLRSPCTARTRMHAARDWGVRRGGRSGRRGRRGALLAADGPDRPRGAGTCVCVRARVCVCACVCRGGGLCARGRALCVGRQGIDRYTAFIARRVASETRADIQNAVLAGVGTRRGDVVNLLSSVLGRVVEVLANAESLAKANFQSVRPPRGGLLGAREGGAGCQGGRGDAGCRLGAPPSCSGPSTPRWTHRPPASSHSSSRRPRRGLLCRCAALAPARRRRRSRGRPHAHSAAPAVCRARRHSRRLTSRAARSRPTLSWVV